MNDKQKLVRTIIKWSLYGLLMVGTIFVFAFSKQIFGGPLVKVDPTDPNSEMIRKPESIFKIATDSEFLKYFVEHAIPNTLATIRIAGVAITLAIALHYLAKIA